MYDTLQDAQTVLNDVCAELAHYGHPATSTPGNPWCNVPVSVSKIGKEMKRAQNAEARLMRELALLQERIGNR